MRMLLSHSFSLPLTESSSLSCAHTMSLEIAYTLQKRGAQHCDLSAWSIVDQTLFSPQRALSQSHNPPKEGAKESSQLARSRRTIQILCLHNNTLISKLQKATQSCWLWTTTRDGSSAFWLIRNKVTPTSGTNLKFELCRTIQIYVGSENQPNLANSPPHPPHSLSWENHPSSWALEP